MDLHHQSLLSHQNNLSIFFPHHFQNILNLTDNILELATLYFKRIEKIVSQ